MNTFELIALIIIGFPALAYLVSYIIRPFKKNRNPYEGCTFSESCGKKCPNTKN